MKIDEHIKRELESEQAQLDAMLKQEHGLFGMLADTYKGSLRGWMILITAITIALTVLMFYSGYQFFTATSLDDRVLWGISFVIVLFAQAMMKLWTWMEMNRVSLLRSIKHLELELSQYRDK